jgi:hypothetical protein
MVPPVFLCADRDDSAGFTSPGLPARLIGSSDQHRRALQASGAQIIKRRIGALERITDGLDGQAADRCDGR